MMQITTSEIFDEITSRIPQNEYGEKMLIEVLVQLDQMQVVNDLELKEEEKQHTGKHRNTAGQKSNQIRTDSGFHRSRKSRSLSVKSLKKEDKK